MIPDTIVVGGSSSTSSTSTSSSTSRVIRAGGAGGVSGTVGKSDGGASRAYVSAPIQTYTIAIGATTQKTDYNTTTQKTDYNIAPVLG